MLNIACALFGHHRSKWHRQPRAGIWTSQCRICGIGMERIGPGQWLAVAALRDSARYNNSAPTPAE